MEVINGNNVSVHRFRGPQINVNVFSAQFSSWSISSVTDNVAFNRSINLHKTRDDIHSLAASELKDCFECFVHLLDMTLLTVLFRRVSVFNKTCYDPLYRSSILKCLASISHHDAAETRGSLTAGCSDTALAHSSQVPNLDADGVVTLSLQLCNPQLSLFKWT